MSKIRIYELAKELSVENKIVLDMLKELGLGVRTSHSSSLDGDEADQVRRLVLRKAMGNKQDGEKITQRVDKAGETGVFVERRRGNVIRRRRAGEAEVEVGSGSSEAQQAQGSEGASDGGTDVETPQQPEPQAVDVASDSSEGVTTSTLTAQGDVGAPAQESAEVVAAVSSVETSASAEAAVVKPTVNRGVQDDDSEPLPIVLTAKPEPVIVVPKKPVIGPKVLGKIELAPKKVEKAPLKKGTVAEGWSGKPAAAVAEDEEDGKPKSALKKGRKRSFSRGDLIDYDGNGEVRRLRGPKRQKGATVQNEATAMKAAKRVVAMSEMITVGEIAKQMSVKSGQIIAKLIELGVMATINQALDKDTAEILATEFGYTIESTSFDEKKVLETSTAEDPATLKPRPPVVTVMGHVDHGKTSLLDAIRKTSVVDSEAGGITQHIGAYQVQLDDGKRVTFLDTPGHAAFTSMRARGAQITDIVILVCASDEGPMPQTIEALNHAKAANVAIVVALTKTDKPGANPDRVKQQLAEKGLAPEEWGGDTMYFPVSATKRTGLKELLEGLLLVAEVKELKANPDRKARGTIVEARKDMGRGVVATVLVQGGTLRVGDYFVSGAETGRIRSMQDANGVRVKEALPSQPVEVTGFDGMPGAGDDLSVLDTEAQAREVAADRSAKKAERERSLATGPISLEEFAKRANNAAAAELNVILKGDVQGSIEAVRDAVEQLSTPKVKVRVLHGAVGAVNESDVALAQASKAIIVGFNVRAEPRASVDAEGRGIELRFYRIIYELLDDVKKAMAGLLQPVRREKSLGRVEVRETFNVPKIGTIAGCYVSAGMVRRNAMLRLLRDSKVVHEGKMSGLRRFKDDVREVQTGYECGISLESYNDVKPGDILEIFEMEEIAATLD
jgi:translation initiation factor IF-2